MKCGVCPEKATTWVEVIYDRELVPGDGGSADGYACTPHAEQGPSVGDDVDGRKVLEVNYERI